MWNRCNRRPGVEPPSAPEMQIPIVRDGGRIIGWTDQGPEFEGTKLRHREAERLLGGAVACTYVQIDNRADAQRAGAPPEWSGPWRCLAICSDHARAGANGANLGMHRPLQPR
jgi:hypothetical protein